MSRKIVANFPPGLADEFYTLLMAAMRCADTDNLWKLIQAFPDVWDELQKRYNAPGGALTQYEKKLSQQVKD
jgi:hypothetical protein